MALRGLRVLVVSDGGPATVSATVFEQLGATVWRATSAPPRRPGRPFHLAVVDVADGGVACERLRGRASVVVSVTPLGLSGPYSDHPQPEALYPGITGPIASQMAGAHAALVGLAGTRMETPLVVDMATLEVLATCLGDQEARALCSEHADAPALASSRPAVVRCVDGYVAIAAPTAVDRAHLAALTGVEAVTDAATSLEVMLGDWARHQSRTEIVEAAQLWRLPVVPVLAPHEALEDEQSRARRVWAWRPPAPPVARSPFRWTSPTTQSTPVTRQREMSSPLSDTRVLDLGMVWSGPYCGRLLAQLGAEVIKVEGPHRRDGTRPVDSTACAGIFANLNRGKASLVLDLAHADGRAAFLRLAATADVLVENFSPRVMPNFRLPYADLSQANPSLVMLSMPAFGSSGPWANWVAYGSGLELATGLAGTDARGWPEPVPVAYLDYLSGTYGAIGIVAALLARDRTGQGAHLEVAQREVACQVLATSWGSPGDAAALTWDTERLVQDPHLRARGLFAARSDEEAGCAHLARAPWHMRGVPAPEETPAPAFGAHSRRLLRELAGMDVQEVQRLLDAGVLVAADGT